MRSGLILLVSSLLAFFVVKTTIKDQSTTPFSPTSVHLNTPLEGAIRFPITIDLESIPGTSISEIGSSCECTIFREDSTSSNGEMLTLTAQIALAGSPAEGVAISGLVNEGKPGERRIVLAHVYVTRMRDLDVLAFCIPRAKDADNLAKGCMLTFHFKLGEAWRLLPEQVDKVRFEGLGSDASLLDYVSRENSAGFVEELQLDIWSSKSDKELPASALFWLPGGTTGAEVGVYCPI